MALPAAHGQRRGGLEGCFGAIDEARFHTALLPHQEDQTFRWGIIAAAFMVDHAILHHNHPHPREEVRLSPMGRAGGGRCV